MLLTAKVCNGLVCCNLATWSPLTLPWSPCHQPWLQAGFTVEELVNKASQSIHWAYEKASLEPTQSWPWVRFSPLILVRQLRFWLHLITFNVRNVQARSWHHSYTVITPPQHSYTLIMHTGSAQGAWECWYLNNVARQNTAKCNAWSW